MILTMFCIMQCSLTTASCINWINPCQCYKSGQDFERSITYHLYNHNKYRHICSNQLARERLSTVSHVAIMSKSSVMIALDEFGLT